MLVDWNEGYISVCPTPEYTPIADNTLYIPISTWGFIKGDISEQGDLMNLLTTIESGLTPDQIALLVNADEKVYELGQDIIDLTAKHNTEITDITTALNTKANTTDVYTKEEIDSKGYLTEHQSLVGYATEQWVESKNYLTEHQDLTGYATESWVESKNYLTEHQDLTGYATQNWVSGIMLGKANTTDVYTKEEIDSKGYLTEHQSLVGYATESWVAKQGYLTEHQSLNNYYTKTEVDTAIENVEVDLTGYATESWVEQQDYITEHQIWTGTQDEWDALTANQQSSYIIAMIEL